VIKQKKSRKQMSLIFAEKQRAEKLRAEKQRAEKKEVFGVS